MASDFSFVMFAIIPIIFCGCVYYQTYGQMRGLPKDAVPIHSPEKEEILGELAGHWQIVPVSAPSRPTIQFVTTRGGNPRNIAFSTAYVTGSMLTLSGGPRGRTQSQSLFLSRTPNGTLWLDKLGSYVEVWDKANGELHINNALGMRLMWRRQGTQQQVIIQQPVAPVYPSAPAAAAPAVVVLPQWWSTKTDPNGRVYYRNAHNGTTSWTPPTAQQIAAETREREEGWYGQTAVGAGGLPPPAYDA